MKQSQKQMAKIRFAGIGGARRLGYIEDNDRFIARPLDRRRME